MYLLPIVTMLTESAILAAPVDTSTIVVSLLILVGNSVGET